MKGVETSVRKVLEGTKQFVIPAYQRSYAWQEQQWAGIWRPVEDQYRRRIRNETPSPYFMGSLVIHGHNEGSSALSRFDVIDGQQRLTTVVAMLAALRDRSSDHNTAESIDEQILRNKFAEPSGALKLAPKALDRHDMEEIVLERRPGSGRVKLAYQWFSSRIDALFDEFEGTDRELLQAILDGLLVVEITTAAGDNPHRIFQTLNSTGVGLQEVDKLRSHFFMLLPNAHEAAHAKYWLPLEEKLPGQQLARFLWVDLTSRGRGDELVKSTAIYETWQRKLQEIEDSEQSIIATLADLKRRGELFHQLTDPSKATTIDVRIARLNEWGTNVHQPLTFHLLERHETGAISTREFIECIDSIESYLVRRMLVGLPTNNLNRIFATVVGQISVISDDVSRALEAILSEPAKRWPTDRELRSDAVNSKFAETQRSPQRHFVLRRIEESIVKDGHIDWASANFSLEHFMPQQLTTAWAESLSALGIADPVQAHADSVHTVGNLTLTSLNQKLSNSPIERKQQIISATTLCISSELLAAEAWGPDQIAERSRILIDCAMSIWKAPRVEVKSDDRTDGGFIDWIALESVLASLEDGEWTTLSQLNELVEPVSEHDVLAHIRENAPRGSARILTAEGLPDIRFPWVRADYSAYKDQLVEIGVFGSTDVDSANPGACVPVTMLAERL
ncbi:DUF262 domain-containing protein [Paraoerskovia marina]|uniref:DUF262 domain-containing protein n=1 Tax=Paraoerskovia marina TaxID=545619 RepID=UPI0009DD35DA|nr:DUF262 domain-containing protein [Paraoerskovia marina]